MADVMHQFEIKTLSPLEIGCHDFSFTNSSMCMVIAVISIIAVFSLCLRKRSLIPNTAQNIPESAYEFVYNMLKDSVGKDAVKYISFIFTVFLFVLVGNILGLFPYSFTFTSHFATVGTLSLFGLLFNVISGI